MKQRADQMLVERRLAESRAKAQALILAGLVYSGERKVEKAGQPLAEDAPLEVRGREHPWVSRGGRERVHRPDDRVGRAGRGKLDRRVHRRAAAARGGEGLRSGRRHQPARLEAAERSPRRRPRTDQCTLPHRGRRAGAGRHPRLRRELHRTREGARYGRRPCPARRTDGRPGQAAVRGGAARDRQGRRGARSRRP